LKERKYFETEGVEAVMQEQRNPEGKEATRYKKRKTGVPQKK
jgi:hypothetical protein